MKTWKPKKILKGEREKKSVRHQSYDNAWKEFSKAYRTQHPFCVECLKEGIYNSDDIHVDHIIPLVDKPELKFVENNLQSLCRKHHGIKTYKETLENKNPE